MRCIDLNLDKALAYADESKGGRPPFDAVLMFKISVIQKLKVTDATTTDGARLREGLLDETNTESTVWADTAYRPKANEDFMEK